MGDAIPNPNYFKRPKSPKPKKPSPPSPPPREGIEQRELLWGAAELLILSFLDRRPLHGYQIFLSLSDAGLGTFSMKPATLYPILYRLERVGWIVSRGTTSPSGRPRKVYSLTTEGQRVLGTRTTQWERFTRTVGAVLKGGRLHAA